MTFVRWGNQHEEAMEIDEENIIFTHPGSDCKFILRPNEADRLRSMLIKHGWIERDNDDRSYER